MSTPQKAGARESDTVANVLSVLRRRWIMVVAIVIACMAVAVAKHVRTARVLPGELQRLLPERDALRRGSAGIALGRRRTPA